MQDEISSLICLVKIWIKIAYFKKAQLNLICCFFNHNGVVIDINDDDIGIWWEVLSLFFPNKKNFFSSSHFSYFTYSQRSSIPSKWYNKIWNNAAQADLKSSFHWISAQLWTKISLRDSENALLISRTVKVSLYKELNPKNVLKIIPASSSMKITLSSTTRWCRIKEPSM